MVSLKKTLLIEDDKIAQRIPTLIFECNGWEVDVVETGRAALDIILKNQYDLVLIDIGLPDIDGRDLAKIIHAKLKKSIPIIALSAHSDILIHEEMGINSFIKKPLTSEIFNTIIDNYFSKNVYPMVSQV